MFKGAPSALPALAPPRADTLSRQLRRDALGLLVGVGARYPPVGCDDNEPRMRAVIIEPLDEFAVGSALASVKDGMWHLRIERTLKLVAVTEPLPTVFAHANDVVRVLRADLADRVQRVLTSLRLIRT